MLTRLDKFGTVYGTDFSEEAVAFANLAYPNGERVKQEYLPDGMPFENGKFDVVTALDVLEHVEDDKASAETLLGLLKPGGILIVTVPAYMLLWSGHDVVLEHKRRYVKAQLAELFQECVIEKLTYYNSILFPPIWAVRKFNSLFRPNRWETDDELPRDLINKLFLGIMRIEKNWLKKHTFPFGVSLLAVIRKKEN
jgi:SAM-dependent methyltransferase